MSVAGFEPLIDGCSICGKTEPEFVYLDINEGALICNECTYVGEYKLSRGALNAARYILNCDSKKLYSFSLGQPGLKELAKVTESYLLAHLDRQFRTLNYYKGIIRDAI
jgi:DNA repair protein RecO (recombination protein O)